MCVFPCSVCVFAALIVEYISDIIQSGAVYARVSKKGYIYIYIAILPLFFFFSSCGNLIGAGLGEEVDLTPPVLSVSHLVSGGTKIEADELASGVFCQRSVTFYGTATDNNKVSAVRAQVKRAGAGDESYVPVATARLSGSEWELDIDFEDEGPCYVKITAEDPRRNFSPKSERVITLFVDYTAPVAEAWYIDREISDYRYGLKPLEYLKELVGQNKLDRHEYKDVAQNVSFTLRATASDTMGIKFISASIYDEAGNKITDVHNNSENQYAPSFPVTHEMLESGSSELASGIHYLQVWYEAEDVVTVPESNKTSVEVEGGWFIWWPESDLPRVTNPDADASGLGAHINDTLSFDFFDDDALGDGYFALLSEEEYGNRSWKDEDWADIISDPESLFGFVEYASDEEEKATVSRTERVTKSDERHRTVSFKAAAKPQTMHLVFVVWDNPVSGTVIKAAETRRGDIPVRVTDDASPILIVSSPKNNSVPALTMKNDNSATVTIEGQSLDSVGCTFLEFVWVPDCLNVDKRKTAEAWLDSIVTEDEHNALKGSNAKDIDGMRLWSVPLETSEDGAMNGFVKHTFKFEVDLFKDFTCNGTNEKTSAKYFLAKLTRKDGGFIYQDYTLAADTAVPTVRLLNLSDMQTVSTDDLTVEFYGAKESGLTVKEYEAYLLNYKITNLDPSENETAVVEYRENNGRFKLGDAGITFSSGTYKVDDKTSYTTCSFTIPSKVMKAFEKQGIKPRFMLTAKDLFGLEGQTQCMFNISSLPILTAITSTSSTLAGVDDEITINATFSDTVTVGAGEKPRLRLTEITNGSKKDGFFADYNSGSGTTTLEFIYKVKEGDKSDKLEIPSDDPIDVASDSEFAKSATFAEVPNKKNLQDQKTIKIDGISPRGSLILESNADENNNVNGGKTYLREGRTLTVKLDSIKAITVQGSASVVFNVGEKELEVPLSGTSNLSVTFSKKIAAGDPNGELELKEIKGIEVIKDSAGNKVIPEDGDSFGIGAAGNAKSNFVIDTTPPAKPTITITNPQNDGKYKENVKFTVSTTEEDVKKTEYSLDDGVKWSTYPENEVEVKTTSALTARATDWAGNVSDPAEPIHISINSTFPAFTVECTDPDGYHAAGKTLTFKVHFADVVEAPSDTSNVYIQLSAVSGTVGKGSNGGMASFVRLEDGGKTAVFEYVIQDPDEFYLQIAEGDVKLTGFTDTYGCKWDDSNVKNPSYPRPNLHCDGVAPKVKSMTVSGNVVTLTFAESVKKAGGNITLRQVKKWAIPPVLTAADLTKIMNKLPDKKDRDVLSMRDDNGSDIEDAIDYGLREAGGYANDKYFGTGQYIGPYKKSYQGVTGDGRPDLSTKYVLHFDLDIWNDSEVKVGPTYRSDYPNSDFGINGSNTVVEVRKGSETRTTQQIRDVLEKAGYHERVLDVTSSLVSVSNDTVTITFPAGLTDTSDDLPAGREWELVIDKGAFMDETGNEFGAEPNGYKNMADAVQYGGQQYSVGTVGNNSVYHPNYEGSWGTDGRGSRSTPTPVVLIKSGESSESFFSGGVATPWVRVDRYSYGLGIYQPSVDNPQNGAGGPVKSNSYITAALEKPTGLVRVRIDCETSGASVKYVIGGGTGSDSGGTGTRYTVTTVNFTSAKDFYDSQNTKNDYTNIFAAGTGDYKTSCKQYIVAKATKTGFTDSGYGAEAVWQSVVHFVNPTRDGGASLAGFGDKYNDFSIRGASGSGMQPYYTPYPLRLSLLSCPYLRRTYLERKDVANSNDYYWVSYEIFLTSTVSGHGSRGNNFTWTQNDSSMEPGEVSTIHGLKLWP